MRGWVRFLQSHGLIDLYCPNGVNGPDGKKKTSNSVAATLRHKMMICDFRFAVLAVFLTRTISSTAVAGSTIRMRGRDVTAARQLVLPDYPVGIGATISTALVERPTDLRERTLSTFLVNYKSWRAGRGIYRAADAALSHSVATANACKPESARRSLRHRLEAMTRPLANG